MTMSPRQRAAVRNETLISIAINALIPTAVIRVIGLSPPSGLLGLGQLVHGMSMASGLATFLMTLAVTLIVRNRVRKQPDLALANGDVPAFARWLPRSVGLRMLAMALVAVVLLVPLGAGAATLLAILPLGPTGFVLFNLLYGTLVGLTMTPAVVLRALADPVPAR